MIPPIPVQDFSIVLDCMDMLRRSSPLPNAVVPILPTIVTPPAPPLLTRLQTSD